jgi:hypothetical protein
LTGDEDNYGTVQNEKRIGKKKYMVKMEETEIGKRKETKE